MNEIHDTEFNKVEMVERRMYASIGDAIRINKDIQYVIGMRCLHDEGDEIREVLSLLEKLAYMLNKKFDVAIESHKELCSMRVARRSMNHTDCIDTF